MQHAPFKHLQRVTRIDFYSAQLPASRLERRNLFGISALCLRCITARESIRLQNALRSRTRKQVQVSSISTSRKIANAPALAAQSIPIGQLLSLASPRSTIQLLYVFL